MAPPFPHRFTRENLAKYEAHSHGVLREELEHERDELMIPEIWDAVVELRMLPDDPLNPNQGSIHARSSHIATITRNGQDQAFF